MRKLFWTVFLSLATYVGLLSAATLTLTDAPNESSFGGYKATLNANWALIEAMLSLSGDATVAADGTITVTGSTGVFTTGTFYADTAQTATGGVSLAVTPTTSYVVFHASANATNTIVAPVVAGAAVGTRLTCANALAQTVILADGTTLALSGTLTLGQYDTVDLIAMTTGIWAEVSTSDN